MVQRARVAVGLAEGGGGQLLGTGLGVGRTVEGDSRFAEHKDPEGQEREERRGRRGGEHLHYMGENEIVWAWVTPRRRLNWSAISDSSRRVMLAMGHSH